MACLMIQGTGSDVGKSLVVAGLCRAFTRRGMQILPFKPQNMSNNAAVTQDGGEIGRAQTLQARACGVAPTSDMNPVLLKPQSDIGSQIIVQGKVYGTANARDYQTLKPSLLPKVMQSFRRLQQQADLVVIEGAGSAAEINLRANDIANMGFARAANVPVVLLADIDRGGVIAQIVGTKAILDPLDAALVRGFIVNRFRGDSSLFQSAMDDIARRTHWPALGLVGHFADAWRLPAEDAMALRHLPKRSTGKVHIAVLLLTHISNFDDFDPLKLEPEVRLEFIAQGRPLPGTVDLVILPGSKTTIADLQDLRAQGWDIDLAAHMRRSGKVLGLCGGYQMLGHSIADPQGLEGVSSTVAGLGLLQVDTILTNEKRLTPVAGRSCLSLAPFSGYEMHMGLTQGADRQKPFAQLENGASDGAVSADGRVCGTYIHGLFADPAQRAALLAWLGGTARGIDYEADIEITLDRLADHISASVDLDQLWQIAQTCHAPA